MHTFFEKKIHTVACERLGKLISFCPEERFLVHGDFGFDNMLCGGNKITGVLDWSYAAYGDFLYDIAYLDFWPTQINLKEILLEHFRKQKVSLHNGKERILCSQIVIGLTSLNFFAKSNQREKYEWARDRLLELLSQG